MRIIRFDACGAKHRHTWTDEMQNAKSMQKIPHHSEQRAKLREARARAFEENFVRALCWRDELGFLEFVRFFRRRSVSHFHQSARCAVSRHSCSKKVADPRIAAINDSDYNCGFNDESSKFETDG
jgi:hypothetical protein